MYARQHLTPPVSSYTETAVMEAKPFGIFQGREAIRGFWRDLILKAAKQLQYQQIKTEQIDAHTVLIAAQWQMNIGGGVITHERWIEQDGSWMLAEDRFEVLPAKP